MEFAQLVEDKIVAVKTSRGGSGGGPYRLSSYGGVSSTGGTRTQTVGLQREVGKERSNETRSAGTFKRLTESEIQAKRAKGLCFRCDEKFSPGHRCKDRTLQVLTVSDEEFEREAEEPEGPAVEEKHHGGKGGLASMEELARF